VPRYRGDQFRAQLNVQGLTQSPQSWDSFDGGDVDPTMEEFLPGGMGEQVALGGIRKRQPITLTRAWDTELIGNFIGLDAAAGVAPFTLAVTTLGPDKTTVTGKTTYTGVVGKVTPPKRTNDDSKTAMLTVVLSCNGAISS
jgi:hypothetical protein